MRVNLAGKKQGEHKSCLIKPSFRRKFGGEPEYYLDLENEGIRRSQLFQTVNFYQIQIYP